MNLSSTIKKLLGPKYTLTLLYLFKRHSLLSLQSPGKLSEKIIYRRLYPKKIFSHLSDKAAVREYVKNKIGEEFLVPVYKVVEELSVKTWRELPESFIIKTNHGAGFNHIVYEKSKEDFLSLNERLNRWLKTNFSKVHFEMHYQEIKPKLVIEKLLVSKGEDIKDYKIHVFHDPLTKLYTCYIQIISDRNYGSSQKRLWLNEDLTVAPFKQKGYPQLDYSVIQNEQVCLKEAIVLAKKLTSNLQYCRVDFYIVKGEIYFGEMTFTPHGGNIVFEPGYWDRKLGKLFTWPEPEYDINEL